MQMIISSDELRLKSDRRSVTLSRHDANTGLYRAAQKAFRKVGCPLDTAVERGHRLRVLLGNRARRAAVACRPHMQKDLITGMRRGGRQPPAHGLLARWSACSTLNFTFTIRVKSVRGL